MKATIWFNIAAGFATSRLAAFVQDQRECANAFLHVIIAVFTDILLAEATLVGSIPPTWGGSCSVCGGPGWETEGSGFSHRFADYIGKCLLVAGQVPRPLQTSADLKYLRITEPPQMGTKLRRTTMLKYICGSLGQLLKSRMVVGEKKSLDASLTLAA